MKEEDWRQVIEDPQVQVVHITVPNHLHAEMALAAAAAGKHVFCQKPLTHHVTEARAMAKLAKDKNLITQMGIQVHSFYDYKFTDFASSNILFNCISKAALINL